MHIQPNIAVDTMGGDEGPRSCVSACLKFCLSHPEVGLTLFGDREQISAFLPANPSPGIHVRHASAHVVASDKPGAALRGKRDSSMALAVKYVADGHAQACVSAGNTGALMAFGLHYLKVMDGIERPAICKAMPSVNGCCYLLDVGANVQSSASNLLQFAHLGSRFAQQEGVKRPRVGLLNVGVEAQKGANLQRDAAECLRRAEQIHFIGFVEGGDVYRNVADVVVCDGFSGNVLLKASEGAAEFMRGSLKQAFNKSLWTRLSGLLASPLLSSWQAQFDPNRYNGAIFLGLNGIVVKSHGSSGEMGFVSALEVACTQVTRSSLAGK